MCVCVCVCVCVCMCVCVCVCDLVRCEKSKKPPLKNRQSS